MTQPPVAPTIAPADPRSASATGPWARARRVAAIARIGERALSESLGAAVATWLARAIAFGFALALALTAGSAPEAVDPLLRIALIALSLCGGLAAFSAAGQGPAARLRQVGGLLRARGLAPGEALAWRGLSMLGWVVRQLTGLALLLVAVSLVSHRDWAAAVRLVPFSASVVGYFLALGAALGMLVQLATALGARQRGRLALVTLVVVPEMLAPAWPELPTVPGMLGGILDRCLSLAAG